MLKTQAGKKTYNIGEKEKFINYACCSNNKMLFPKTGISEGCKNTG